MTDKKTAPAFCIDPAPTIEWPVTVSIPVDGGKTAEYQFTGRFKRLSDAELDDVLGVGEAEKTKALPEIKPDSEKLLAGHPDGGGELVAGEPFVPAPPALRMQEVLRENAELFPQLLVGWSGVKNSAGADAPFDIASLKAQVTGSNGKFLSSGLWRAIAEIRSGARLGN